MATSLRPLFFSYLLIYSNSRHVFI
uniref:Uncharacterized protein n=1 Tax=Anguilla anguilla TaxID=7936 RepID=A0A0E9QVA5_ANGAN